MTNRYLKQTLFKDIGLKGQKKIGEATISIVGVGALGSVSSELLTRAGIDKIIICDYDKIDITNLQRQTLYTEKDVGTSKVIALKKHLSQINSNVKIIIVNEKITKANIRKIKADIIIDGTDNMEARFLINEYAKKNNIPFIYGSAAGSVGIVYNILKDNACFNCIFKNTKNALTCHTEGIINSTTYMVASIQASEALKIILNKNPETKIIRFDVWKNTYEKYNIRKDDKCKICKGCK